MTHVSLLRWSHLRAVGHSRLIRTSFVWLLAVPVLARLLVPIAGDHDVTVFAKVWHIHIGLPFHWTMFYWAAVCFAFAQFFYLWWCPPIVDKHANVADFLAQHGSAAGQQLAASVDELASEIVAGGCLLTGIAKDRVVHEPLWRLLHDVSRGDPLVELGAGSLEVTALPDLLSDNIDRIGDEVEWATVPPKPKRRRLRETRMDALSDRFWLLYRFADGTRHSRLFVCGTLFFLGFILFGWVVTQGAMSVVEAM